MPVMKIGRSDNNYETATAVGASAGNSYALKDGVTLLTGATGAGAKLPSFSVGPVVVRVLTTAAVIYPPTGGKIHRSASAANSWSLAKNKIGLFWPHANGLDYTFILTA